MHRSLKPRSAMCLTIASVVLLAVNAGCGTNLAEVLTQSASAAGRTFLDLFITDLVNAVADAADEDGALDDGDADGGDGDNGGDGAVDGGNGGAVDGAAVFADNCAACHGADGASGFAPDITGRTADEVAAGLELGTHAAISMTDEQITAIAIFLGGDSGDGSNGGSVTGDPAAGEAFFAGAGCGACHCADASGGCALEAPSLVNVSVDTLDTMLVGDAAHPGGKQDASAQDLAHLAAYLATL